MVRKSKKNIFFTSFFFFLSAFLLHTEITNAEDQETFFNISGNNVEKPKALLVYLKSQKNETPQIQLFFNGNRTTTSKEGFVTISSGKNKSTIYVLVTKVAEIKFEKVNTIEGVTITNSIKHPKQKKKHKFYKIEWHPSSIINKETMSDRINDTRTNIFNGLSPEVKKGKWVVKKKDFSEIGYVLPKKRSMILPLSPRHIDKVFFDKTIETLTFVLRKDDKKKIEQAAERSWLYSLDFAQFFEKKTEHTAYGGTVSLVQ